MTRKDRQTPLTLTEVTEILDDLVTGRGRVADDETLPGAELVVFDNDTEVFRAALARHLRRDDITIWVRPIGPAGVDPATKLPSFDVTIVRRRALHIRAAWSDGTRLLLDLVTGQRAVVQPASRAQLTDLQNFDTWVTTLTAETWRDIEALDHD